MVVLVAMIPSAPFATAKDVSVTASSTLMSGAIFSKIGFVVIAFASSKSFVINSSFCKSLKPGVLGDEMLITR